MTFIYDMTGISVLHRYESVSLEWCDLYAQNISEILISNRVSSTELSLFSDSVVMALNSINKL